MRKLTVCAVSAIALFLNSCTNGLLSSSFINFNSGAYHWILTNNVSNNNIYYRSWDPSTSTLGTVYSRGFSGNISVIGAEPRGRMLAFYSTVTGLEIYKVVNGSSLSINLIATIPPGSFLSTPDKIVFNPVYDVFYVRMTALNKVRPIGYDINLGTYNIGTDVIIPTATLNDFVVSPDGQYLFTAGSYGSLGTSTLTSYQVTGSGMTLSLFDNNVGKDTLAIAGDTASKLAINSSGNSLFVYKSNGATRKIHRIDGMVGGGISNSSAVSAVDFTLPLGNIIVAPDQNNLLVVHSNNMAIVSTMTLNPASLFVCRPGSATSAILALPYYYNKVVCSSIVSPNNFYIQDYDSVGGTFTNSTADDTGTNGISGMVLLTTTN